MKKLKQAESICLAVDGKMSGANLSFLSRLDWLIRTLER